MTPAPMAFFVPQGLLARCVVHDIELAMVGDVVKSRDLWIAGHRKCAAQIDAIRSHQAKVREAMKPQKP